MATIYTVNGVQLSAGLESSAVSDQAKQFAKSTAREINEAVVLEDDGVQWTVYPTGRMVEETTLIADAD